MGGESHISSSDPHTPLALDLLNRALLRIYHDAANELHALLHPSQRSPWQRIDMAIKCVVIGAGPVGALAGLYAARRGWDVEIYDLRPGMFKGSGTMLWH